MHRGSGRSAGPRRGANDTLRRWTRRTGSGASKRSGRRSNHDETDFRAAMQRLVAERPPGDPVGLFELASAFDSTGHPEPAAER